MNKQFGPRIHQNGFKEQMIKISKKISKRASQFCILFIQHMQSYLPLNQLSNKLQFIGWTYLIQNPKLSIFCSKNFASSGNKTAFRCLDCMEIDAALLCYDCFANSNHKGHTFIQFEAQGGCCDCGNSQVWNQNGFCPNHSKKYKQIQLPLNIKELFVQELKLVYYFYLWLASLRYYNQQQNIYGTNLFEFTNRITGYNLQTKLLVAQLMKSSFDEYPDLPTIRGNILSSILNLNEQYTQLVNFQKISFSLYQVYPFRLSFLICYFKMTNENQLTEDHPLKRVSFQYLTCTKTINKLIHKKKLKPLQLNQKDQRLSSATIISIFRKYYEDINFLSRTKESRQYFISHFQMTNSVNMAFYRKFSQAQRIGQIDLDQLYLKTFGVCLKFILDRKDLIKKSMKQLSSFIFQYSKVNYSLAQQRAFAMATLAYLDGSLEKLLTPKFRSEICSILKLDYMNEKSTLKDLIRKGLKNITIVAANKFHQAQSSNSYQKFFYSQFPQRQFLSHLDIIYHRIWMMLSKNKIDYWKIVEQVVQDLSAQANGEQLISQLSLFVSKLFTQQLNDVAICNTIGIVNRQKIVQFYLRIIATYTNKFTVKQIRVIASHFINNADIFQEVLKQYVKVQKQKIHLINPASPLNKLVYFQMLRTFKFYDELILVQQQKLLPINYLTRLQQISQEFIKIQIQNGKRLLKRLSLIDKKNSPKNFQILLQKQIIALLQIYLMLHDDGVRAFFIDYLQSLKDHLHTDITHYLNGLCKEKKQIMDELKQAQKDKAEEHKKRRQKIQNKRREKEMQMKKNQQIMLKQYNYNNEQPQMGQTCIYCKEDLTYNSYLISYVGLTNLVSQKMFSLNKIHLFVTTCGHKIHDYCYNKSAGKGHRSKCFLCKKRANIIIPDLSTNYEDETIKQTLSVSFLDSIYALLLEQNQQDIFYEFYKVQNAGSILNAILTMIARQAIYYGLHDFEHFQKYSLPAHQLFYQIVNTLKKDQIQTSLASTKVNMSEQKHILKLLQTCAIQLLSQKLLNQQQIKGQNCIEPLLSHQLQKLICLIGNNKKQDQVKNISVLHRDLIIRILPKSIQQLHYLIEKCSFCGKLKNEIYYCLLCDWKVCNAESKYIYRHSSQQHLEGCAFICVSNGDIFIAHNRKGCSYQSYYQNAFGETYIHSEQNTKKNSLASYHLDQKNYSELFQDFLTHNLHNLVDD